MSRFGFCIFVLCISLLASSCADLPDQALINSDVAEIVDTTPVPSTPTPEPSATLKPTLTYTPTITPTIVLGADPQVVNFTADDGRRLSGLYYPADTNPAPLIILMHWARGDQEEWTEIAYWLQNRGQLVRTPDYNRSWKSSDWYPENTLEVSVGIFTFDFRECTGECQNYLPADWLIDVQAAMTAAVGLTGVNREQILTAGSSIGADGAVDGCAWFNQNELGQCLGAFALSPGSLLTVPFDITADELLGGDPPVPVYCLYGLRDDAAVETCEAVPEAIWVNYGYIENHGFELIQPFQDPDPLILLQEFITIALQE
ncbi:MAG: hypothetical protein KAS84_01110 [Anaerolineales bacterium]|nr:hypothetical protein [Anaerolineales bacterium]